MEAVKRRSRKKATPTTGRFLVTEANARRLLEPLSRYRRLPSLYLREFYGNGQGRKRLTTLFHEGGHLADAQKILLRQHRGLNNQQLHELGKGGHALLQHYGILDAQSAAGAVRKVVGIRRGAISDNMRVSFQAARSIG